MAIRFFVGTDLAKPHENGKPDVFREHYETSVIIPETVKVESAGHVDEAIIKAFPKEYAAFKESLLSKDIDTFKEEENKNVY